MSKLFYFIKEGFKGVWSNRLMSIASIGTLTACLLILGSALLVIYNITAFMDDIEGQNEIAVFLDDDLSTTQIKKVGNEINALSNVATCTYVSKEEGFEDYKSKLGDQSNILSGLEEDNPLPNSYNITIKDLTLFDQTVYQLEQIDGVDKLRQRSDVADKLVQIRQITGVASVSLIVLLLLVAMFIISNTIKLAMYVRAKEINIMKYVGATNWFIRWPFILEGLILGALGAALAYAIQWYIYVYAFEGMLGQLELINIVPFTTVAAPIGIGFLALGLIIGIFGSAISIRKYLKV